MPYKDSYIAEIRKYIGHDFRLVMPTVDVVIEKDGKLMLVYNRDFDGWSFPGGYVEPEISWSENAVREAKEEAGLVIMSDSLELIGTISGENYCAQYPNGDEVQLFSNIFLTSIVETECEEIDQTEIDLKHWMTLEEINEVNLTFSGRAVYEVYQKYKNMKKTQIINIDD